MSRISNAFQLNGVNMPTPDSGGITYGKEPLWSNNSGRTASGKFVGDIIAEKRTADISLSGLTEDEVRLIESQLKNAFFTVSIIDPENSAKRITFECYRTPRTYQLKTVTDGKAKFNTVTLSCIER